jgi:predicted nucleotidyltransferase
MPGTIPPIIAGKFKAVEQLCRRYRVRRLDLFGSATGPKFNPAASDLDFALEYLPEARELYPDAYFGLKEDLTALFGRTVDLVMVNAIRNPYFREEVEETRVPLYEA